MSEEIPSADDALDYEVHVRPYLRIPAVRDHRGYVVWRRSAGNCVELLHLLASERRRGYGTSLVRDLVAALPVEVVCVYGFTRPEYAEAQAFYAALGFTLTAVPHLYDDRGAVLFSATVSRLKEVLGVSS